MNSDFAIVFNDNDSLIINPFEFAMPLEAFQSWINIVSEHIIDFPISSKNIKEFFNSIQQNSIPKITWSNVHDFYLLSQEFGLIDGQFKSDINEFIRSNTPSNNSILDLNSNSNISYRMLYEDLISIHINQFLLNQYQVLDNISSDQLYRILSKSNNMNMRNLCKYLLYRYEMNEENDSDIKPNSDLVLFTFLDCLKLSKKKLDRLAEISDQESIYIPNLIRSMISKTEQQNQSLKKKNNEIEALNKSKNELISDNQKLQKDIIQFKEKIENLEKGNQQIKLNSEQLSRENQKLKDKIKHKRTNITNLEQENNQIKERNDQLIREIQNLKGQIKHMQTNTANLGQENNQIKERNEQLSHENQNLKVQNEHLIQEKTNLIANLRFHTQMEGSNHIRKITGPISEQLTSIYISRSVTLIEPDAFSDCKNLREILVDPNNTIYKSVDGVLFTKDMSMLIRCPCNLDKINYTVPTGVKTIQYLSFSNCSKIRSITIPATVSSIGFNAFNFCHELSAINADPNNSKYVSLNGDLFIRNNSNYQLIFPSPRNTNIMRNEIPYVQSFV